MTVSPRKSAGVVVGYRYHFELDGQRYTGSFDTRAEAKREEKLARKAALAGGVNVSGANKAKRAAGGFTLKEACDLYWNDVARHHRSAADIERRLGIVKRLIGAATDLMAIRFATVNQAVQDRRAEPGRGGRPLAPGSVNRDVVDALRPVWLHAARVKELALPAIDWGKLRLKEADPIVREFTDAEVAAWSAELATPTERWFLAMALTYGPRLGELFAPADAFRLDAPGGPEVELGRYLGRGGVWRESRKDGSLHVLPIDPAEAAALEPWIERARSIGPKEPIWVEPGADRAITYYAMTGRLRRAAKRAGIASGRIVHGMRHHAATQIVRANDGSLLMAQNLLGHRQIKTTGRYAHVSSEQLRTAVAKARRVGLETVQETAPDSAPKTAPAPRGR